MIWMDFMSLSKLQILPKEKNSSLVDKMQAVVSSSGVSHFLQDFEEFLYFSLNPSQVDCLRTSFQLRIIQQLRIRYTKASAELSGLLEVYQDDRYSGDKGSLLLEMKKWYQELRSTVKRLPTLP